MFGELMQPTHLLLILIVALLFFGPGKLGELGKGLGDGIRHFKKAMKDDPNAPTPTETKPAAEGKTEEQK
jgi:sec-independent protein translocase protein TatA